MQDSDSDHSSLGRRTHGKEPIVLMKRIPGETLDKTGDWKTAKAKKNDKQCIALMSQTMEGTCKQIVDWAVHKQFLHADFQKKNVNVVVKQGNVQSVNVFDMGPPFLSVQHGVKEAEVKSWCEDPSLVAIFSYHGTDVGVLS
ncbi:hypothetical protein GYMLUDRAFT_254810 [Collybiopsis luxurians FD-317 M1]|nr:hypothetical protein GYMLUDRAFT_254810 [Collybiopsis luxurians FD-317 M1]